MSTVYYTFSKIGDYMNWKDDENRYEKFLVLDEIIKFSSEYVNKDLNEISFKELLEFIDKFVDNYKA